MDTLEIIGWGILALITGLLAGVIAMRRERRRLVRHRVAMDGVDDKVRREGAEVFLIVMLGCWIGMAMLRWFL